VKIGAATSGDPGRRRALTVLVAAVVVAAGVVLVREVAAATVAFQEQSLAIDPGETTTLHARTPIGVPLRGTLSWSVDPAWLGKMDEAGGFHAGDVSGSGTLTARSGPVSAQIPVTVTCPRLALVQGIRFEVSCNRAADVYEEVGAQGGAARAAEEVERETDRVSRDLQMASDRRFRVYYLGSTQTFALAISWLGRGFTSGPTVHETDAVYMDLADLVAIDQSALPPSQTGTTLRHELVHRSLRQLVGYPRINEVPTWLNEGWAFLEESESGWLHTEARVVSASSAYFNRLPSLVTLSDLHDWNGRTGLDHVYQYYAAAQAAQFLMDDITVPGLVRTLKLVGTGESFASALAHAAPEFDFNAFGRRLSDRVKALVPEYPGITVASGSPGGAGSTVIAYGLKPGAAATVTLNGPTDRVFSGNVDLYGIYVKYLGPELPVGEYRVTLEADGRRYQVTATR
jgi:hypothetical protein